MTDLPAEFFLQGALTVAPRLLGCRLAVDGRELIITETEAYRGESDTACPPIMGGRSGQRCCTAGVGIYTSIYATVSIAF